MLADNVVPRIGVLAPEGARAAIREMFLAHVIGGKHLSASDDFRRMVRGATPDVVLAGVELLARGLDEERPGPGTSWSSTSAARPPTCTASSRSTRRTAGLSREVVAVTPVTRTVEGDLGMRWSALSTVEAAGLDRPGADAGPLPGPARPPPGRRRGGRRRRADRRGPRSASRCAATPAASGSSSAPRAGCVERTGKDLREVDLLVGSGGVLRHGRPGVAERVLAGSLGEDVEGGWQLPRAPRVVVDVDYVLCAVGLLAGTTPTRRTGWPARLRRR